VPLLDFQLIIFYPQAVIAAEPRNRIIGKMLEMYETGNFESKETVIFGEDYKNFNSNHKFIANNDCLTWCILKEYPMMRLNNKLQRFEAITVYPNSYFDVGDFWGKCYSRHIGTGFWNSGAKSTQRQHPDGKLKRAIKKVLLKNMGIWSFTRKIKFKFDKKKKSTYNVKSK